MAAPATAIMEARDCHFNSREPHNIKKKKPTSTTGTLDLDIWDQLASLVPVSYKNLIYKDLQSKKCVCKPWTRHPQ